MEQNYMFNRLNTLQSAIFDTIISNVMSKTINYIKTYQLESEYIHVKNYALGVHVIFMKKIEINNEHDNQYS